MFMRLHVCVYQDHKHQRNMDKCIHPGHTPTFSLHSSSFLLLQNVHQRVRICLCVHAQELGCIIGQDAQDLTHVLIKSIYSNYAALKSDPNHLHPTVTAPLLKRTPAPLLLQTHAYSSGRSGRGGGKRGEGGLDESAMLLQVPYYDLETRFEVMNDEGKKIYK